MNESISRRRALAALLAPALASCSDRLLGPLDRMANFNIDPVPPFTLIGAGDQHAVTNLQRIHREKTAAMVKSVLDADPTAWAFNAGDLTHKGSALELQTYDVSWGQFRERTLFTLGNHDRMTDPTASLFYNYTGSEKYFALILGAWRFYVLTCESMEFGGPNHIDQIEWLKADLQEYSSTHHVAAMWHYPHFSNICAHAGRAMTWPARTSPWWQILQDHGAEFVISGHVHRWERFARMLRTGVRTGVPSEAGIRQFAMGTGGGNLYNVLSMHPDCESAIVARGVARFDLHPDRYEWTFTDTAGVVRDSGSQTCRTKTIPLARVSHVRVRLRH